ncbi:MAG: hypothetical protein ABIG61_00465 [Planctomycetota bacterium]
MLNLELFVSCLTAAEKRAISKLVEVLSERYEVKAGAASIKGAVEESTNLCWIGQNEWQPESILDIKTRLSLNSEAYLLEVGKNNCAVVASKGKRGLVYGIYDLCERIELAGGLPKPTQIIRKPFFKNRRWSAAISNTHRCAPWDERLGLLEGLKRIIRIIEKAPEFGINSFEINGRPFDGWDIDWILPYERYKEFRKLRSLRDRQYRMELLEEVGRRATDNLVDLYVWSHEIYFPPEFFALYHQAKGVNYAVCPSKKFVQDFIKNKYEELFKNVPSLTGIVLSVNESGYFSILTETGCECSKCRKLSQSEKVALIVNLVAEACENNHKDIVIRTFQHTGLNDYYGHKELETIHKAYKNLPSYVKVMSKYCPLDFGGGAIIDEPLIGVFKNDHIVEFSLDREWQGRTFVPAITPLDLKKRICHAKDKKCIGLVGRVDFPFPEMEPEETFTHPNEFNVYVFSRLSWDPNCNINKCWQRWATARYGAKAAPAVISALKKTEQITEKLFFYKGITIVNYHNMIASREHSWAGMVTRLPSKWDKSKKGLTKRLFNPNEKLIKDAMADGDRAYALAAEALKELSSRSAKSDVFERTKLVYYFEKLRDYSVLRKYLVEMFFRCVALNNEKEVDFNGDAFGKVIAAADNILRQSLKMEALHGVYSWPIFSPDRGVSAYEFVEQHLAGYLETFLAEPVPLPDKSRWVGSSWVEERTLVAPRHPIIRFWDGIIQIARGRIGDAAVLETENLSKCSIKICPKGRFVRLMRKEACFDLPVGMPIKGPDQIDYHKRKQIKVVRLPDCINLER